MTDLKKLSDKELRSALEEFGCPVRPLTDTSRRVLIRKLKLLTAQQEHQNRSHCSSSKDNIKTGSNIRYNLRKRHPGRVVKNYSLSGWQLRGKVTMRNDSILKQKRNKIWKRQPLLTSSQSTGGDSDICSSPSCRADFKINSESNAYRKKRICNENKTLSLTNAAGVWSTRKHKSLHTSQRSQVSGNESEHELTQPLGCFQSFSKQRTRSISHADDSGDATEVSSESELEGERKCSAQFTSCILLARVLLFFTALTIIYICVQPQKTFGSSIEEKKNRFPICTDGSAIELCIEHRYLLRAVKAARLLYSELHDRAVSEQCSGGPRAYMTHVEAYKWLRISTDGQQLEEVLRSLKILLISNPHWGIFLFKTETRDSAEISTDFLISKGALVVTKPNLPLICRLRHKLKDVLIIFQITALVTCFLVGAKLGILWYMKCKEQEKVKLFSMVDRIIKHLMQHQGQFLAVNHMRDQLIPPADRKDMAAVWNKAVEWIKHSESRVRCEFQLIAGEELLVWRWLPSPLNTSRHSTTASQEPLLTPCLKIRCTFNSDNEHEDKLLVQDAVLQKCVEVGVAVLHISADCTPSDGIVYLKCTSEHDAQRAFLALQGWQFGGSLVTVKYMCMERYHKHFPEAQPLEPTSSDSSKKNI